MRVKGLALKDRYVYLLFLLFSFITLFIGTRSSPLYPINEWVDPNAYFTMAKCWINGFVPYKDYFDHKGPFLYVIYAIGYLLSNDSFTGIYILQAIALSMTLYFIYKFSNLFVSTGYAYIVSLLYSIIFFKFNQYGGSAEEFIIPLQVCGLYIIFKYFVNKSTVTNFSFYILGLLIGVVALIKINLIIIWFFPLCAIFLQLLLDREYKKCFKYIFITSFGILSVIVPFIFYFFLKDALLDFIQSYIVFNIKYFAVEYDYSYFTYFFSLFLKKSSLFILIGTVCFSLFITQIKNVIFRISIPLIFISLFCFIYMGYITNYGILGLCILFILPLIFILSIVEKKIKYLNLIGLTILTLISLTYITSSKHIEYSRLDDVFYMESIKVMQKEKSLDFICLDMDRGVYFRTNTLPQCKYYYIPNISHKKYPFVIDSQIEFIKKESPMFIFTLSSFYESYFKEVIDKNYTQIVEKGQYSDKELLFKRND